MHSHMHSPSGGMLQANPSPNLPLRSLHSVTAGTETTQGRRREGEEGERKIHCIVSVCHHTSQETLQSYVVWVCVCVWVYLCEYVPTQVYFSHGWGQQIQSKITPTMKLTLVAPNTNSSFLRPTAGGVGVWVCKCASMYISHGWGLQNQRARSSQP